MVNQIYPPELQLNKVNSPIFYLHLSSSNGFVSSIIYDKRDDCDFLYSKFLWMVTFPVLLLTGLYFSSYSVC